MKQVRAIALFLLVGAVQCDQSLWQYVYNPGRLRVLDPCISVSGSVEEVRKEADGDVHILFRLDQQFESLLNEKNVSRQYGALVLEPICQGKVRQADRGTLQPLQRPLF